MGLIPVFDRTQTILLLTSRFCSFPVAYDVRTCRLGCYELGFSDLCGVREAIGDNVIRVT